MMQCTKNWLRIRKELMIGNVAKCGHVDGEPGNSQRGSANNKAGNNAASKKHLI